MEASGTVDGFVNAVAHALAANRKFNSLCDPALRRVSRSSVLQHLINALGLLSLSIRKHAKSPLEKATAWMLKGCKTAIALQVCELISPEKHVLDRLLFDLDQASVSQHLVQEQRLKRFLEGRFANLDRDSQVALQISHDTNVHNRILSATEDKDDGEELPDIDVLSNLSEVENTICSGFAYDEMCKQLKNVIFPSPCQTISSVLREQMPVTYDIRSKPVAVVIEWQILEYVKHEAVTVGDLDYVFTLSGELDAACAAPLGEYISTVWNGGKELLDVLKTSIELALAETSSSFERDPKIAKGHGIELQLFPASATTQEQAYVMITGTFDEINDRLQQLAWIAATLRLHFEGQLTVSDVDIKASRMTISNSVGQSSDANIVLMSFFDQDKVIQADNDQPGQCWASICPESVLARGFPVLRHNRPDGAFGLEMPFRIMAAFAGVKYPLLLKQRIVFASKTNVLIPEVKLDSECIQWHFERSNNWIEQVVATRSKSWDPRLETLDLASLTGARGFLGYCKTSEMLLGTVEFEHVDVFESDVPRTFKVGFKSEEHLIGIDADERGYAKVNGTTWKFSRGETALVHAPDLSSDERLKQASERNVLLYDQKSSVAFLVPELSFVLQMVTVYLRQKSQMKRTKLPLARISADGGEASWRAIEEAKDLVVPFAKTPPQRYVDIVESFLDIAEQRSIQALIRKQYGGTSTSIGLLGWDNADFQTKRYEFFERELQPEPSTTQPIWWRLFQGCGTLVIFTGSTKFPIRNSSKEHGVFDCCAWDNIPTGKHLLLANMRQLQQLQTSLCRNTRQHPTRYMLSNDLAWVRPADSRLFEQSCRNGGSCNPMQTMIKLNLEVREQQRLFKAEIQKETYLQHPGKLDLAGAVLFADNPKAFEHRHCWRRSQAQVLPRSDRNYLFVAATLAAILLVYWNFWFFLFSLALLAAAYALS